MSKAAYIVDIDGTLANLSHRLHYIESEPKQWDAFFEACADDLPIQDVIDVVKNLPNEVIYCTGRPERVREHTMRWIQDNGLPYGLLVMRRDGDHRPDTIAKKEIMAELQGCGYRIAGVFEDRPSVVRVWREMGLTVFQMKHEEF